MKLSQREHMMRIMGRFIPEWTAKYTAGTREHEDTELDKDFSAKELLLMAKEEAQDSVSYLYTLEEKLDELVQENERLTRKLKGLEE